MGAYSMIDVEKWIWTIDKKEMTCRNDENNVTVKMNNENGMLKGKLHDMPMELFGKIAELENGEEVIIKIVKKAEKEFLRQ